MNANGLCFSHPVDGGAASVGGMLCYYTGLCLGTNQRKENASRGFWPRLVENFVFMYLSWNSMARSSFS